MSPYEYIKELLFEKKIYLVSSIPLKECRVMREYKLTRCGLDINDELCVYMIAVPYKCEGIFSANISEYAICRDYHLFYNELFSKITKKLEEKFLGYKFRGFADSSPIDEIHASAKSGLGIIGKNNMLITEKYSSYVFLGEIITNYPESTFTITEISECESCGACISACPKAKYGVCLSSLTQKKGALTEQETNIIKEYGSAWGCDICQAVCPHTKNAIKNRSIYTDVDFFKSQLTKSLSREIIKNMSDEEFLARAYSWRKKETILRNLDIIDKAD